MSAQMTPAKRPHDRSEPNGKGKWQKTSSFNASSKISHGSTVFRILCPASKTGSVIGKGGNIINQIRQETGVKVRVEDTLPGCDERVIFIVGYDKENAGGVFNEQSKDEHSEEMKKTQEEGDNNPKEGGDEAGDANEDNNNNNDNKPLNTVEISETDNKGNNSAVQKALFLVFERMVEGESGMIDGAVGGGDGESSNKSSSPTHVRLLVLSNQVGCLFGKGGNMIKQLSSDSGAEIHILPREKLPPCANHSDDLVQISGETEAVRRALKLVSQQLIENPPRDSVPPYGHRQQESSFPYPPPQRAGPYGGGPRDADIHMNNPPSDILTYRLLCPDEKVGGVIGKGGAVVRGLQHDTGCEIKVLDGLPGSDDRVIVISAPAHPEERISPAQDAVLRVQAIIVRAMPESKEKNVTARLLVPSYQIGCLLGKGGAVINEMRKLSGAFIRILGKDNLPKCATENDELVQVSGDIETVQDALMQITGRLKEHLFRDAFPPMLHHGGFPDQGPPFPPPFMGRREFSPPPFHGFNGGPQHGGFHPHDDRPPFMHHRPGFPPHMPDRMPPPGPWGPPVGLMEGGPMGIPDYAGHPRRVGGFGGGGGHPGIITNTTVEVVVPNAVVPVIYGEDGGCLRQIREISDAKINITDPKPGASETVIIISGTPEQNHAAQSLIQAFVMSESEALSNL